MGCSCGTASRQTHCRFASLGTGAPPRRRARRHVLGAVGVDTLKEITPMPSRKSVHTAKWDRCVQKVGASSKGASNPYAVCTASLGSGSFKTGGGSKKK